MRKTILLACMILGLSAAANNGYAISSNSVPSNYADVINNYIDSYMNGDYKKLNKLLSDDASFKIPRAEAVLVYSKDSQLEQMKKDGVLRQSCTSQYALVDKSDAMIIAKVDFKYSDFTQHNYLILEKDENKAWKITQVCKFFEDVNTTAPAMPAISTGKKQSV